LVSASIISQSLRGIASISQINGGRQLRRDVDDQVALATPATASIISVAIARTCGSSGANARGVKTTIHHLAHPRMARRIHHDHHLAEPELHRRLIRVLLIG